MKERMPWVKWSFDAWENDPALKLCSMGARGFWMSLLCIAAKTDGYVLVAGKPPTPGQLAKITAQSPDDVAGWLAELEEAGVFSRDRKRTIYSRRMVNDAKIARRNQRNGKTGGNPNLRKGSETGASVNPLRNPPSDPPVKAEKNKRREEKKERTPQPPGGGVRSVFDQAFEAYPPAGTATLGKPKALAAWTPAAELVGEVQLLGAVQALARSDYIAGGGRPKRFDRWLIEAAYEAFLGQAAPNAATTWPGPPEIRAEFVRARGEDWTRRWLDRWCSWRDVPERSIVTAMRIVAETLRGELSELLSALGVVVVLDSGIPAEVAA